MIVDRVGIVVIHRQSCEKYVELIGIIAEGIGQTLNEAFGFSEEPYDYYKEQEFVIDDYWKPYKLDFTRPNIRHQVMNNKPKHLIKKIIR